MASAVSWIVILWAIFALTLQILAGRDDWDDHLPYVCMAYRATPHESTGVSPNIMMFGTENNLPLDVMVGLPPSSMPSDIVCETEYIEWLRGTLTHIYQYADEHLHISAKRQKAYYDLKAKPVKYQVGQFVWRWYPPAEKGKLSKGWTGPWRVMQCPTDIHCVIRKFPDTKETRVHIDCLKPHTGQTPIGWQSFDDDSENYSEEDTVNNTDKFETELLDNELSENEIENDDRETDINDLHDLVSSDPPVDEDNDEDPLSMATPVPRLGRGQRERKVPCRYSP